MLWNEPIKLSNSTCNGYQYFYAPKHPLATIKGLVYLHRHIASEKLNRWLLPEETVHHIDNNRANNNPNNLIILSRSKHTQLHKPAKPPHKCPNCQTQTKNKVYCSTYCEHKAQERTNWPSNEKLAELLWQIPTSTLAKQLKVSDKAITNRCRRRNISKPPRGYWRTKETKKA